MSTTIEADADAQAADERREPHGARGQRSRGRGSGGRGSGGRGSGGRDNREHYRLGVSSYDRASSLLVSLLVMAGVTFFALVIIFFARQFVSIDAPIALTPLEPSDRPPDAAMGVAQDIEPPGIEDAPDLTEPAIMDTLNALTSKLSSKVAILSDQALDANKTVGKGSGLGDNRKPGGGGGPPEPGRELRFEVVDEDEYAQFLDFYKIELGAFTPGQPDVYYASKLSAARPAVREGKYTQENRYAFNNSGPHRRLIERLAQKAGIASRGEYIGTFYPPEAEGRLVQLERARAKLAGKTPGDIEQTAFRVTRKGSKFELSVEEQLYY
ncbi:MAG: hypothetical protein AAF790_08975 [Planctomycetota bacterium]